MVQAAQYLLLVAWLHAAGATATQPPPPVSAPADSRPAELVSARAGAPGPEVPPRLQMEHPRPQYGAIAEAAQEFESSDEAPVRRHSCHAVVHTGPSRDAGSRPPHADPAPARAACIHTRPSRGPPAV